MLNSQDFSFMARLDAIVNRLDRIADALETIAEEVQDA